MERMKLIGRSFGGGDFARNAREQNNQTTLTSMSMLIQRLLMQRGGRVRFAGESEIGGAMLPNLGSILLFVLFD